jgi:hypothetical protein
MRAALVDPRLRASDAASNTIPPSPSLEGEGSRAAARRSVVKVEPKVVECMNKQGISYQ